MRDPSGDRFEVDLDLAMTALCKIEGICHELPMTTLFENFQQVVKQSQLFVQMPNTAALVYAKNDKPGCFCGFIKDIRLSHRLNVEEFLAAHALPGPDSLIRCLLYPNCLEGGVAQFTLRKDTSLSQIPGLPYRMDKIASLSKPK